MNPVEKLESELRKVIDSDRAEMEEWYRGTIRNQIANFLEIRKPNKKVYEVYADNPQPIGIMEATNYIESIRKLGHEQHKRIKDRPSFEVDFNPDADSVIEKLAKKEVEFMISTFLARAISKLGPVVERNPQWLMERLTTRSGFRGGAWIGVLQFKFGDGLQFTTELKIITNFSKYGRPFGQYPMTFHEIYDLVEGKINNPSIEQIWSKVGYVPPPPQKRKRWTKLVNGSVVMHEGKPFLVTTPSRAKKAGVPKDAEQIARLTWSHAAAFLEKADCSKERYKFPDEVKEKAIAFHHNCKWDEEKSFTREVAWKHFFPDGHPIF